MSSKKRSAATMGGGDRPDDLEGCLDVFRDSILDTAEQARLNPTKWYSSIMLRCAKNPKLVSALNSVVGNLGTLRGEDVFKEPGKAKKAKLTKYTPSEK
jgi:hypothetical protein